MDLGALLPFQQTILRQMTKPSPEGDALLIIARGLGLRTLICQLLKVYDGKTNLVLLVNAAEEEDVGIGDTIGMKLKCIGHEMPAKDRRAAYQNGGILSITSRIIVHDMLNEDIPVEMITGLMMMHAESVTPESSEAFIVRLYREKNTTGFLKAFSDQPEQFHFGLAPLQTVMTQLKIRNVHIWPRFHQDVQLVMSKRKNDVVEIMQPLSPLMASIHHALQDCLEASVNEIKRSNALADTDELTLDNAMFKNFDKYLHIHLDPQWHKIGPKTKQLVSDIHTLRKLHTCLFSMDCVAFNQYLETVVSDSGSNPITGNARQHQSPWLFMRAADVMIKAARQRVYLKGEEIEKDPLEQEAEGTGESDYLNSLGPTPEEEEALFEMGIGDENLFASNELPARLPPKAKDWWLPLKIQPVLEEQPKWKALAAVLDEIESDLQWSEHDPDSKTNDTILIMCESANTCSTLRRYLSEEPDEDGHRSGRQTLDLRLQNYFWWKKAMGKMAKNFRGKGKATDQNDLGPESDALKRKREYKKSQPSYKRRRVRGGATNGADAQPRRDKAESAGAEDLFGNGEEHAPPQPDMEEIHDAMPEMFDDAQFNDYFGLCSTEDLVVIRPYQGDEDELLLTELRPKYIIMYDPDTAFIRSIECYRASMPGMRMRTYFMVYDASTEEQKYLSSIRREKDSFERIIRERGNMALTIEAEKRPGDRTEDDLMRTVNSRLAGGSKTVRTDPPRILVDIREFRSSLPSLLHAADFRIVPLTLGIGDYILSPSICVERKSVPDLIQSFNSGRLYQQCEMMSIHYKQPTLLIEWDQNKAFSLKTYQEPKGGASAYTSDTDLHAKLVLLTLNFPRLRIIWSPSPYFTSDVFADLKTNQEEPDPAKAVLVGGDSENGEVAAEGYESAFMQTPQDILRTMPGVTSKNFRYIMSKVKSLEELAALDQPAIAEFIGNEAARTLHNFIHQDTQGPTM